MIYIIISIVLALIAFGCLKSRLGNGIIPICIFCFGVSAVITSGVIIYKFFAHPENHKIETETIKRDGVFSIDTDKEDTYTFKREKAPDYQITTKNIIKDTVTFVKTVDYTLIYPAKEILPDIHFRVKSEDTIHLSQKDYAIYKAYKDSLDKRR